MVGFSSISHFANNEKLRRAKMKRRIFAAIILFAFVAQRPAFAGTEDACAPSQPENCIRDFLSTADANPVPAPPFHCQGQELPAEWGCKNPVNYPNQPSWCYCENGYAQAEAEFRAALVKALPNSIPASRFDAVMGTMTEEEKQRSLAVRDWYACGYTVDWLVGYLFGN